MSSLPETFASPRFELQVFSAGVTALSRPFALTLPAETTDFGGLAELKYLPPPGFEEKNEEYARPRAGEGRKRRGSKDMGQSWDLRESVTPAGSCQSRCGSVALLCMHDELNHPDTRHRKERLPCPRTPHIQQPFLCNQEHREAFLD